MNVSVKQLVNNNGQIPDVPKNPRFIRDDRYALLKANIEAYPEMLAYRELLVFQHGGKYIVLCGNMRLRAMKELGYAEAPCKVIPAETTAEKLRAYVQLDNVPFGANDHDALANEWNLDELNAWGMEFNDFGDANKEIDTEGFGSEMLIKLKYTETEYIAVKEQLAKIAPTPEAAVWKLLGNE
jgi:ParB-like chromosome segregation protein Spo0J